AVVFSSRRRHTRCYRDWSSDVCSSDLLSVCPGDEAPRPENSFRVHYPRGPVECAGGGCAGRVGLLPGLDWLRERLSTPARCHGEIGRASCREGVEMGAGEAACSEQQKE